MSAIQIISNFMEHCSKTVSLSLTPLFILSLLAITFLIIILQRIKLAVPDPGQVSAIFGPNPFRNSLGSKKEDEDACNYSHHHRTLPMRRDPINLIIGHRCAGGMEGAPENSLVAIRKCASRGCSMVEFDVSLTKDLVPVLFHDDNLLRVMGVNRRISEINWEDLRQIDISQYFPGERVPRLEVAVELCLQLDLRFIIDIKEDNQRLIDSILTIFKMHASQGSYWKGVVSSFYFSVIYKIRKRDEKIVGCMAWRPYHFALPLQICGVGGGKGGKPTNALVEALFARVCVPVLYQINDFAILHGIYPWLLGLSALLVHKDALNAELVDKLEGMGVRVYAWTVNCPLEKQYLLSKLQVGYLTDRLSTTEKDCPCAFSPSPETWLCNNNLQ